MIIHLHFKCDSTELITAIASTVPDIATVAVRANMVEDAFSIGSLADVTWYPDFASLHLNC